MIRGDSLLLSGFNGGHAFLFTARVSNNQTIKDGHFYSGAVGKETWTAKKNNKAVLPAGYRQIGLHEGQSRLKFRFRRTSGDTVSIDDEKYKNKVVIVQILGSWCPNCMDETAFLSDNFTRNKQKGIVIIGLAYKRTADFEQSRAALQRFQKRFTLEYPGLVTWVTVSDKQRTEKTLPQLTEIKAFSTSIFIDKKGNVRKIYSGFCGLGTGEHYQAFQKEFEEIIHSLLNG